MKAREERGSEDPDLKGDFLRSGIGRELGTKGGPFRGGFELGLGVGGGHFVNGEESLGERLGEGFGRHEEASEGVEVVVIGQFGRRKSESVELREESIQQVAADMFEEIWFGEVSEFYFHARIMREGVRHPTS